MPDGYDTHAEYMDWVRDDVIARQNDVCNALRSAFVKFIELREVEIINFSTMTAMDLAKAIHELISRMQKEKRSIIR